MARGKEYINFILDDKNKILDLVDEISPSMSAYIENHVNSEFILLYKFINHSDLPGFGKAMRQNQLDKNIL